MGRPRLDSIDVATRERLLLAAEVEFGRAGFAAARLEDIAQAAGIRRPSLLYHFGSKERLYAEVVEVAFGRLGEALRFAMEAEAPDFPARLDAVVRGFTGFLEARPGLAPLVLREILDARGPGHELLRSYAVPVLDQVEAFVRRSGKGALRRGLPLRPALVQIVSNALVYASAGSLRGPLWGEANPSLALARALLLEEAPRRMPSRA